MSYLHVIVQVPFDMGSMQLLEKCLKGLKCLQGEKRRDRRPITVNELAHLHSALRPQFTDSIDNVMLWAAFTLAFFGFLRCREFTCNSPFDAEYHLSRTFCMPNFTKSLSSAQKVTLSAVDAASPLDHHIIAFVLYGL